MLIRFRAGDRRTDPLRGRLLAATLTTALSATLLAGVTPAQATVDAQGEGTPGPQTSGDSLFPDAGNGGYDVRRYDIQLAYQSAGTISATTVITAQTKKRLSSFSLDLEGLTVSEVTVNGRTARYSRRANKLVVTPRQAVRGKLVTKVVYAGRPVTHMDPDGSREGWIPTADGATTLNEPVGAMTWYPNNNTPRDKATFVMAITVPEALSVASNGELSGRERHGPTTTWTWEQNQPMTTYTSMISIGVYDLYRSTMTTVSGRALPILTFINPSLGRLAEQRKLIPKIVRFAERRFGPYPLTSVGMVVKNIDIGYALETQNRPFFDGAPDTPTLVHELAHQWFGSSVTPRDWGDIWLNEGFANHAESLYTASNGGPSTAAAFHTSYEANPEGSDLWRTAPARLIDPANLFSAGVYVRGGMTLEVLRQRVGSRSFFAIMRRWAATRKDHPVSTADFVALSEQVSGRNLGALFNTWLYLAERPSGY